MVRVLSRRTLYDIINWEELREGEFRQRRAHKFMTLEESIYGKMTYTYINSKILYECEWREKISKKIVLL